MKLIACFIVTFCLLIFSVFNNIFLGYSLAISYLIFAFYTFSLGYSFKQIIKMTGNGAKKVIVLLEFFMFIGMITSSWMSAGTIGGIVYYGTGLIRADLFILFCFLLSSFVSFLLGSSFGTCGTIGVALIVMARMGSVNPIIAGGAIVAGSYFGDRCSPMSSSANLVASLTKTDIMVNVRNMFKTSIIPFILAVIIYTILSFNNQMFVMHSDMRDNIALSFTINMIVFIPAVVVIVMLMLKTGVKKAIFGSIVAASIISIAVQGYRFTEVVRILVLGFELDKANPLYNIIKGGGMISMLKSTIIVSITCAITGLFDGADMLKALNKRLLKCETHLELFVSNIAVSIVSAVVGCNQAIAIVMTSQLMGTAYEKNSIARDDFAKDIENTCVVLSPLIPWNISVYVPATTLGVELTLIPFAVYLYLLPLVNLIYYFYKEKLIKAK